MNIIKDKSINQLLRENFVIPIYQRAYKWREIQVSSLLNDIVEFDILRNGNKNMSYCLQPLIVKACKLFDGTDAWSVIDGQQRLTTIKLILLHLGKESYSLHYPSRIETETFLQNLSPQLNTEFSDHYFISKAYIVIKSWFEEQQKNEDFSIDEFYIALSKYTKFIWYELINSEDDRDVFTRINLGKIPLNNAELIRALFLNESNWPHQDYSKLYLRQIDLANQWNNIEIALQHNEFWYFLNKKANMMDSRIEFLFELDKPKPRGNADIYYTFSQFNLELNKNREAKFEAVNEIWKRVLFLHQVLWEWFSDWEYFHKIGYLICNGAFINDLISIYRTKKKSDFVSYLDQLISDSIKGFNIDSLSYVEHKAEINKVLLLFNINTILKGKDEAVRFSFYNFKDNDGEIKKWSLEHINAQSIEKLNTEAEWREWLELHLESLIRINKQNYKGLIVEIQVELAKETIKKEIFETLHSKIKNVLDLGIDPETEHLIGNLALLDGGSNTVLSNSLFEAKRYKLIDLDKGGKFIPLGTRNVFLKYYTPKPDTLLFWSNLDQEAYLKEIKNTITFK
jgi:uncharacterized protein with ParB-like and HNH nuclease domain